MIAIYLRLSMADGDLGDNRKDESNSIENQRLLLQNFIMDHEDLAKEALAERLVPDIITERLPGDGTPGANAESLTENLALGIIAEKLPGDRTPGANAESLAENLALGIIAEKLPGDETPDSITDVRRCVNRNGRFLNILEYVDDGYSGTNFERPSFQRMIEDCRNGIVTTIIVKDISRFGRNYIGVGDYIDQLFPLLGVRFISANNNYDSNDYAGEPMSFDMEVNNLISTFYSRDLSKKIKSTKSTKWRYGISTSSYAPYGYLKGEKGKFVIDPEAAANVQLIFSLACDGWTTTRIADELNRKGILTPGMYNRKKGIWPDTIKGKETEQFWTNRKVCNILRRYEYTGALVAGRYGTVRVGTRRRRHREKKDWTVVEDVNVPLVSKEDFHTANSVVRKRKPSDYIVSRKYALKGKVKCGNCNRCMTYNDTGYERIYYCAHGLAAGKYSKCSKERVNAVIIEHTVWNTVWNLCRIVLDTQARKRDKKRRMEQIQQTRIAENDRQMKSIKEERMQKYELYANGCLNREEYLKMKKVLTEQTKKLQAEKEQLLVEIYLEEKDGLSADLVEDMVKGVRIFHGYRMEIELNYADMMERYIAGEVSGTVSQEADTLREEDTDTAAVG